MTSVMQIGDRVKATRDLAMVAEGAMGTVVKKYVPMHATMAWTITVRFDGCTWDTQFPYPSDCIEKVIEELVA